MSLAEAIARFNAGDFYGCHDVLEELWHEALSAERPLYQGLLQIAVGLHHEQNANLRGAALLLADGLQRLRPYDEETAGFNLEALRPVIRQRLTQIQRALAQGETVPWAPLPLLRGV
ncbi:MAG: DUF309 domain-containing protein [Oscillatoriales cyanobacterium SM2_1_8]|nr:DUF309 domain-containing protein [Oscillatoriales cyanobacterium SM2_1_8]